MSEQAHDKVLSRARRDFFTNPTFAALLTTLSEMQAKETESLKAAGRGESITQVNYKAGMVDGVAHCIKRLENERADALQRPEND